MGNKNKGNKQGVKARSCFHWQDPVEVGEFTVAVSGLLGNDKTAYADPDLGIYLASDWISFLNDDLATPGLLMKDSDIEEPQFYIARWKDYDVIELDKYSRIVDLAAEWVTNGKRVEIGCMGAHGRTGTLLAGLFVKLLGLGALDAIKAVRSKHCGSAIEGKAQEKLVYEFAGEEYPKPAPKDDRDDEEWWRAYDFMDTGAEYMDIGATVVNMAFNDDVLSDEHDEWLRKVLADAGAL